MELPQGFSHCDTSNKVIISSTQKGMSFLGVPDFQNRLLMVLHWAAFVNPWNVEAMNLIYLASSFLAISDFLVRIHPSGGLGQLTTFYFEDRFIKQR